MPESKSYREKIYAQYATVQVPSWLRTAGKAERRSQLAIAGRLRGWLPQDKNISCLDLGCGAGDLILALQAVGFHNAIGVDGGPEQVVVAKTRGVSAVQAGILEYLQASDEFFDLILAFDVIEHLTKDEVLDVLNLIWKRMKPGGRLIVQTPNAMSPWVSSIRYGDLTHELIFSPNCMESILRMSGFKSIKVKEVGPYIDNFTSMVRWVLWKFIWTGCLAWSCVECGGALGGVYTRNMLVCAVKDNTAR